MEQFRWFELERRSELSEVPDTRGSTENRWGRFLENLEGLEKFGVQDWHIESNPDAGEDAGAEVGRDLEERSKSLGRVAGEIRELFQWYFNVPTPEIDSISAEALDERLVRITSKVNEVIPLVIAAVDSQAALDVEAFPRMMRGLAEIEALTQALQK